MNINYYLILLITFLFLSSCENEEQAERISKLEEDIENLDNEISDLEEDFYIAYSALGKIKQCYSDTDSVYCLAYTALSDLGDKRFYRIDKMEIDILTSRFIDIDTEILKMSRSMRHSDFIIKQNQFQKSLNNKKSLR